MILISQIGNELNMGASIWTNPTSMAMVIIGKIRMRVTVKEAHVAIKTFVNDI